jgi:hypothetical protein
MGLSQVGSQVKGLVRKVTLLHYIGNNINSLFPLGPGSPRAYQVPSQLDFLFTRKNIH